MPLKDWFKNCHHINTGFSFHNQTARVFQNLIQATWCEFFWLNFNSQTQNGFVNVCGKNLSVIIK